MFTELHCCSAFSFLRGASTPEELAKQASNLGYPALALLDRDGVHGAPRFYAACLEAGIRPLVGAEVTLNLSSLKKPIALPLLVESRQGYRNLCRLITRMKLRSVKGSGSVTLSELEEFSHGLICLSGGTEGPLRSALRQSGQKPAFRILRDLQRVFGTDSAFVELQRHFDRRQEAENQTLVEMAAKTRAPLLASNGTRYSGPDKRLLLDVLTCIRHRTNLDEAGRLLEVNSECYLKSPSEMQRLFADHPRSLSNSIELSERLDFTLQNLGYRFPDYPVPNGGTMHEYLREMTEIGARQRYRPYHERARRQIARELELIGKLELSGYFLIVWDLVRFCRRENILAQGRGSAANSAVCYSLGITAVDPVGMDLLFERFLSEERGEWPDIDLDLPSGDRRERVIQYVYERYGKHGAAMTANVITYRGRSAAREVGKALGFSEHNLGRLSRLISAFREKVTNGALSERFREAGLDLSGIRSQRFFELWKEIQNLPRHLGQHSGGMVIAKGALDAVVPLENATMPDRHVVQWDKEDCADLGIIKVDLLGLGMMSALQDSIHLIRGRGGDLDLAHLPPNDPKTYDLLQKADTVGVFQVESRAQMATLPRLKPRCFYDLVVEIAIIRPGPIVGQMVHPYLRRRDGLEPVTYPHPSLAPILERTLGVPIFQEQLLKIAMVAAGFTGGQAEALRRAMGFKRSVERIGKLEDELRQGMSQNGITGDAAEEIVRHVNAFALYGFPESHSASFALLAYASAYIKAHHPSAFYTALLNNQPMGFYHPSTLVKDAQHRGQRVRPIDVLSSDWLCRIEEDDSIRLGLRYVSGLRHETGSRIELQRKRQHFSSIDDLLRRTGLRKKEMAVLAEIGALNSLGFKRRQALWQVEKACRHRGPLFDHDNSDDDHHSPLREMTSEERLVADYRGSGMTVGPHPMGLLREELAKRGISQASSLRKMNDGFLVRVAGTVIVRQRPMTAKGFLFMSLEDETGISNIVVTPDFFEANRLLLLKCPALMVEGRLQNQNNVISVKARRFEALNGLRLPKTSHDFH